MAGNRFCTFSIFSFPLIPNALLVVMMRWRVEGTVIITNVVRCACGGEDDQRDLPMWCCWLGLFPHTHHDTSSVSGPLRCVVFYSPWRWLLFDGEILGVLIRGLYICFYFQWLSNIIDSFYLLKRSLPFHLSWSTLKKLPKIRHFYLLSIPHFPCCFGSNWNKKEWKGVQKWSSLLCLLGSIWLFHTHIHWTGWLSSIECKFFLSNSWRLVQNSLYCSWFFWFN